MKLFNPKYDNNKKDGKIYIGKKNITKEGEIYRAAETLTDFGNTYLTKKNKDDKSTPKEFNVIEKITLYESPIGQQKYSCWLIECDDENKTRALHLCRRTSKGIVFANQELTLNAHSIGVLKQFLDKIKVCDEGNAFKIETSMDKGNKQIVTQTEFSKIIENNIDEIDDYYRLIDLKKKKLSIEKLEAIINDEFKNEVDIQKFLKNNLWLFGSQYCALVEEEKINSKNILDGIPKNLESYVDIIEVKLPTEQLFVFDSGHKNFYSSSILTKAIAQTQNYIFEMEQLSNDSYYQDKNNCKIIKPRGIILIGSKNDLNEEENKYLRILNSSYHNLQVITYQQLLARAKNMLNIK